MKLARMIAVSLILVFVASSIATADSRGRIYGRLTTVDGDVFEGLIRWDRNEGSWVDFLNGNKELARTYRKHYRRKYREREEKIRILGLTIRYIKPETYKYGAAQCGIRFGHIKMLEFTDDDAVLVVLKTGDALELESSSTDIGEAIRELVIEDRNEGDIEFEWDDVERIDLMQADAGLSSSFGERLYGTVTTRRGDEFTGWICWDIDETFTGDLLDGKEKRRNRKIEFGKIRSVERHSASSARVTLHNGSKMKLRGTNDVDDDNRGIVISDPNLGQVVVEWDDFERLDLSTPPGQVTYDEFDGGHRIEGTVYTEDGEQYTGKIRWDDDEEYTWEVLDGDLGDIELDVEFGFIREIKRKGYNSSIITLWDGRSFRLDDSNDVDDDNKGIFIELKNGDEIEVDWDDFDRVEFASK